MYNYHANEKRKHMSEQLEQQKQISEKFNQKKAQKDRKLIKKFIERSTHGYERMLDVNQDIKEYREYQHQFRDFDKNKNIGPPSFYYQCRNAKERVNQASKQNNNLDEVPFFARENPTSHKFRETKSKHDFKYTSYDTTSRVIETVQGMKTNEVPTSWDLNVRSYIKALKEQNEKPKLRNTKANTSERNASKVILPLLNIKHHPKSIESIKNKIGVGPLKDTVVENRNSASGEGEKLRKPILKTRRDKIGSHKCQTVHVGTLQDDDFT